ncbi:MAG: hypothetical protein ACK4V6_18285, partial [Microthrixaceae bacterium]
KPKWLFTETATGGTFTTDADGTHTLTLNGIDPEVTAFTDRPDRDTAIVSTEMFVRSWPSIFEDSAPNAVLVEHEPTGASDSFVLTLTDPKLDGTTLTFTAEIVDGKDHSDQLPGLTPTPHREPPATFSTTSLFIDDAVMGALVCIAPESTPEGDFWMPEPVPRPAPVTSTEQAEFFAQCELVGGRPVYVMAAESSG